MAIEVYDGLYSGQEIDDAVTTVNSVVPSTATAQNKLATEADISQLDTTVSGLVSDVADIQGDIDNILDDVSDLDTSVSTINSTITDIQGDITDIDGKIPSTATSSNKLATMADLPSGGIAGVQINSTDLTPDANDKVNIPLATAFDPGVIRASYNYAFGMSDNGELLALGAGDDWNYNALSANAVISKDTLDFKLGGITDLIPSTASTSNLLATVADIPSGTGIAGVQINGVDLTPDANNKVDIPMSGRMVLGVIKTSQTYCTDIGISGSNLTGELCASEVQYADYASLDDSAFISKGTLDNVLAGMSLDDVSDETWTFVVDDGQGGTTTVTKTIKVGT